mgnify:CR=1 FL=1
MKKKILAFLLAGSMIVSGSRAYRRKRGSCTGDRAAGIWKWLDRTRGFI